MSILSPAAEPPGHVLVACHAWYRDMIGGSFRLASEFAEHLASHGHHVSYLCCGPADDRVAPQVASGVRVYRYEPPVGGGGFSRLRYHIRQTARLAKSIHRDHPVNMLCGHSPLQSLGAAKALKRHGVAYNYTVHSPFDDELLSNTGSRGPGLQTRVAAAIARRVDYGNIALADRLQTVSRYTMNSLLSKHGRAVSDKGIVAPGWVETERFRPALSRKVLRSELGDAWDTEVPVLFTLRRLESRMGLDTFVQACRRLAEEGLEFRTLIGGSGSLKESLQQMIDNAGLQQRVRLLGRLPENQLAAAYAAADCFILPTRSLECFGLIVLEAFACGTPVIAAETAAIPEIAARQGSEWMFEPGNVDQLTDRIRAFVTGNMKPAVNLRDIAVEYDRPKILKRWEELLVDMVAPVDNRQVAAPQTEL